MKWFYKILRSIIVTLIVLALVVPAALYVALSLPPVQRWLCHKAEVELTSLLTVDVDIEYVQISPFNRVTLHGVGIDGSDGKKAIGVQRLGAGLNLWNYLFHDRIVMDYAEIIGMQADIHRDSIGSPLNIQPIIDALKPKDKSKPPTKFDFRINTVVIRTSKVSYNVLSEPEKESGFDMNHIEISGLRADVQLPQIKNDDFIIDLRRLAFNEQCGLALTNLSGQFHISNQMLEIANLQLSMPLSRLTINNQKLTYNGFDDLKANWRKMPFDIHLMPGSHLATTDIEPLVPQLNGVDMVFTAHMHAIGDPDHIEIKDLHFSSDRGADIRLHGEIYGMADTMSVNGMTVDLPALEAHINAPRAVATALRFASLDEKTRMILSNLGDVDLKASFTGDMLSGEIDASLTTSEAGSINAQAEYSRTHNKNGYGPARINGELGITDLSGAALMKGLDSKLSTLTDLDGNLDFDIVRRGKNIPDGTAHLDILSATIHGQTLTDFTADISNDRGHIEGSVYIDNALLYTDAQASAIIDGDNRSVDFSADIRDLNLTMLGLSPENDERLISMQTDATLSGHNIDDIEGRIDIRSFAMSRHGHPDLKIDNVMVKAIRTEEADTISLSSEIADASVTGKFKMSTLVPVGRSIIAQTLPALTGEHPGDGMAASTPEDPGNNHLSYTVTIKDLEPLSPLAKMPVKIIEPVSIGGSFNSAIRAIDLRLSAPYLLQGNKLIENTALQAGVLAADTAISSPGRGYMYFTTTLPTKKGPATVITTAEVGNDQVDSHLEWKIDRERDFSGDINISTIFSRNTENGALHTDVRFNPSKAVFNDTIWTIDPAVIAIEGKEIDVDGFRAWRDRQSIAIGGRASENPTDTITVALDDINLDYVFETLDIPTAMFGGNVTGKLYATKVLTSDPVAYTPGLSVKSLTYNNSLLGDAILRSEWHNDRKSVSILADILQRNERHSYVDGEIFVTADSLDMAFDADRLEIGFLRHYMSAFASDIKGYASGKARLWGSFKLIDMTGDIYGEDVSLTLGFTNCTYTTTDSIRLRPGVIDIDNLTLHDAYGHEARLNGYVRHKCFKEPRFEFRITDARDLLVYDVKENTEHPWYGRVFGTGNATVTGVPGMVDIAVNMSTAANSAFTFVLSDALSAQDYKFITFRDRDQALKDSIAAATAPPPAVVEIKRKLANGNVDGPPTGYKMNFNIDINPQALITLVMDPVGGDRIRAYGNGVLRMIYDSANEDLRMNGTYTVDRGNYNFTLQDIIIKDFTINPGSSIAFHGDPYAAQLDLTAKYQVKANLTDLDESFLEDKELNRTNVPVDALLIVKGDMRQPEINFDIDLPTLTSDTKRKVRSIINTDEMMSRQIIYLLALNRFYTPDYMNATRGNEFMSVASGTISSQLSNMLGQLSDNWAIAPNFRSDRGDFSDMEFDVALSSHLLNNRLLLNGNLGYRDKTMNNNSFIGDFDIEYLLNRSGSLRLKAYNRYNDQNYYFKSALTTQGVGIMFKRDFDSFFSFMRPLLRHKKAENDTPSPTDSVKPSAPATTTQQTDTIPPTATSGDFLRFK